jgi:hypothetical protein
MSENITQPANTEHGASPAGITNAAAFDAEAFIEEYGWTDPRIAARESDRLAAEERMRTPILPEAPPGVAELLRPVEHIEDLTDLHSVASALVATPIINREIMRDHIIDDGEGHDVLHDVSVPMSRIVGIESFGTWAGRGFYRGSLLGKGSGSSLAQVAKCASLGQIPDYIEHGGAPKLQLFEDAKGEVWAIVTSGGSHRVAGARARGDERLYHADVETAKRLPRVDFEMANMLSSMQKSGLVDGFEMTPQAYADEYAQASKEREAEKARRQAEPIEWL